LLEIDGAIIGRYRSYEKAAELISSLTESVEDLARKGTLTELPGIGEGLAAHIQEILKTGDYSLAPKTAEKISAADPGAALPAISWAPRKSPCSGANSRPAPSKQVEQLAREQKLREIPGFGEKSEENILHAIAVHKKISGRFLLVVAEQEAARLVEFISKLGKPGRLRDPRRLAAPRQGDRRRPRPAGHPRPAREAAPDIE
jgi:DNA polymerase (family 10)